MARQLFVTVNGPFHLHLSVFRPWHVHVPYAKLLRYAQQRLSAALVGVGIASVVAIGAGSTQSVATTSQSHPAVATLLTAKNPRKSSKPAPIKKVAPAVNPFCVEQAVFSGCPTWSLDFNKLPNGPLDPAAFTIYTGKPEANQEAQYYTDDQRNVGIENGSLVLRALNESRYGYRYTSARINTLGKHDFLYGKLVVHATLPAGIGTWPAIWMLPTDNIYKNAAPLADPNHDLNDGEIDIAEAVGLQPNTIYGIAHSLARPPDGPDRSYYGTVTIPGNDTAFHDYGLEWTPASITFTLDGKPYFTFNKQPGADFRSWPYDQRYHLILNLALGGTWGGTDRTDFPLDGVDPSILPATMQIKSINYYAYLGH